MVAEHSTALKFDLIHLSPFDDGVKRSISFGPFAGRQYIVSCKVTVAWLLALGYNEFGDHRARECTKG